MIAMRSTFLLGKWSLVLSNGEDGMDFWTAAGNFGVAVACLAVLGIGIWQGVKWLGKNVLQPVAERHIKFLDDLSTAMANQSQSLQAMIANQAKGLESQDHVIEAMQHILERVEHIIDSQDQAIRTRPRRPSQDPPSPTGDT